MDTKRIFQRLAENSRSVEQGVVQAERAHKEAIRSNHRPAIDLQARVHMLLVGLMAEARLRRTLFDPAGFNSLERSLIMHDPSQLGRWKAAVTYSFRRHYVIPVHLDVATVLTSPGREQYLTLIATLDHDLKPIIEDRNKAAHAQWEWLMNSHETDVTGRAARPMNYLQIHRRGLIIHLMDDLVHTLAVSEPTFQRDFDSTYGRLQTLRAGLSGRDYRSWASTLHPHPHV